MKIRTLIFGGFVIVTAIAVILSMIGIISTITLTNVSNELMALQKESAGVTEVLNAHYNWRHNLTQTLMNGVAFSGSINPDTCALGVWQNSEEAKRMNDPQLLALLDKLKGPHNDIHYEAGDIIALMAEGKVDEAKEHFNTHVLPNTVQVISLLAEMEERYMRIVDVKNAEIITIGNFSKTLSIGLTLLAIVLSTALALFITHKITSPLLPFTSYMKKASETGDISFRQEDIETIGKFSSGKDEISQLIKAASEFVKRITQINETLEQVASGDMTIEFSELSPKDTLGHSIIKMTENLNSMFGDIGLSAKQVSTGAKHIADGAQSLAHSSTEQAASVENLSGSISTIADMTKTNAEMALKAAKLADTIKHNANKGSRQMSEMMAAVDEINQASSNINKVIGVIDDIAFQTNILALNAAVEAARAGQHGKGFAVVAEEVRNLAAKSAEAAKETGELIANSMEKAELGSTIAGETAGSLDEIVNGINESSRIVELIARSSKEQSAATEQINQGIDQVAQVIQQNSATAEESAAASEEMSGQAAMLEDLISNFKMKDSASAHRKVLPPAEPSQKRPGLPQRSDVRPTGEGPANLGKY